MSPDACPKCGEDRLIEPAAVRAGWFCAVCGATWTRRDDMQKQTPNYSGQQRRDTDTLRRGAPDRQPVVTANQPPTNRKPSVTSGGRR